MVGIAIISTKYIDLSIGKNSVAIDSESLSSGIYFATISSSKTKIVKKDEKEQGERKKLNFGHTFGHALEAATGFGDRLLHGEGVAIGMVVALALSEKLLGCPHSDRLRLCRHLTTVGLPVSPTAVGLSVSDIPLLIDRMGQDKKVLNGGLTFILARHLGKAVVQRDVPVPLVVEVLEESFNIGYDLTK